jgi:DNA repair protein RecN (Recombination protein N)
MLNELRIQNLAVVEDVTLTFVGGLNVLTGSTGAGKSLITSAVNLLLGERASAKSIRAGADRAVVEGIFQLAGAPAATLLPLEAAGDLLRLRREIHVNGRSQAFMNDKPCTLKQLQETSRDLIEPHGQNEQLQLKYAENHVVYLDKLAGNGAECIAYESALAEFRSSSRRLAEFDERIAFLKEKRELLEHRVTELDHLGIAPGEKTKLKESVKILENAQEIFDALGETCDTVYDNETSAFGMVSHGKQRVSRLAKIDGKFAEFAEQLQNAEVTLREVAADMRRYLDNLEFDPQRLAEMQDRLATLIGLERRYNMPLDDLLAEGDRWRQELESVAFQDDERSKLQKEQEDRRSALECTATKLRQTRLHAAKRLDKAMTGELEQLMMRGARFRTLVGLMEDAGGGVTIDGKAVQPGSDGVDEVVFNVRTNPGEAEGSVSEVASSGELSRIALALKRIVSVGREGSVLVLDEIDSGVGADLGEMIADKLMALAERYQIICVTHMPQIAANARRHLVVSKRSAQGRTVAEIAQVTDDSRLEEIARMLGGSRGSDKRLALAAEMLQKQREHQSSNVRP